MVQAIFRLAMKLVMAVTDCLTFFGTHSNKEHYAAIPHAMSVWNLLVRLTSRSAIGDPS